MAILSKFKERIKKNGENKEIIKVNHVAITTDGVIKYSKDKNIDLAQAHADSNITIKSTIKTQVKLEIPILTLFLFHSELSSNDYFSTKIDSLVKLFNELVDSEIIHNNKIKVSVLGKWYDLPSRIVEPTKKLLDATKDYDDFFLNFCMNYNGQDEIVDACKILAMQVKNDKIDLDSINKDNIKSNTYASSFLPPDLIIKNGYKQKINGLLLWDSQYSSIIFTKKLFPEFSKDHFESAVNDYEKQKI
jgi:undecaprenyl diphosphate synthase